MWLCRFLLIALLVGLASSPTVGFIINYPSQQKPIGRFSSVVTAPDSPSSGAFWTLTNKASSASRRVQQASGSRAWTSKVCPVSSGGQLSDTADRRAAHVQEAVASGLHLHGGSRRLLLPAAASPVHPSPPTHTSLSAAEGAQRIASSGSLRPPRGFRDFPPNTYAIHKYLFSVWRQVAEEFGFQEYKAPAVESSSLYAGFKQDGDAAKVGSPGAADIPPHIYRLHGNASEALCLRPELTPSLTRMIRQEDVHRPSSLARRWFSIERVWRHERPGLGRRREHFQWNMDIAFSGVKQTTAGIDRSERDGSPQELEADPSGSSRPGDGCMQDLSVLATAELIAATVHLFRRLGLTPADVRIRVGSRVLLYDLLKTHREDAASNPCSVSAHQVDAVQTLKPVASSSHLGAAARGQAANDAATAEGLERALHVLDRAGTRSAAQTEALLGDALGIGHAASSNLLQRLRAFDVSDDAVLLKLADGLSRLSGKMADESNATNGSSAHGEALPASVQQMRMLLRLLKDVFDVREWVDVDLLIVRGLHYYAGLVFEAFDAEGFFRAIMGGGCYADFACSFACNRKTKGITGVGLGMGDCVLLELLRRKGLLPATQPALDVLVVLKQWQPDLKGPLSLPQTGCAVREEWRANHKTGGLDFTSSCASPFFTQVKEAHGLCHSLRAAGLRVELLLPPQRTGRSSFRHAKSRGAKAVVFVSAESAAEEAFSSDEDAHGKHNDAGKSQGIQNAPRFSREAMLKFQVVFLPRSTEDSAVYATDSERLRRCKRTGESDGTGIRTQRSTVISIFDFFNDSTKLVPR
ncbi:hypothetical protein Efla_001393 [Eimeria flavescens]